MLLRIVTRYARRGICTTPPFNTQQRSLVKLKKVQADYQCDDGRPVFLKGGFCDRVLYGVTLLSCVVGLCYVLATIYDHAKPPSWKQVC
ncbi:hypothetical protein SFRURICE_019220 [Spodoptera frugiperda]|nr:hypothetical protein SFRURICE_019220 [Spodoptera frugiperda]